MLAAQHMYELGTTDLTQPQVLQQLTLHIRSTTFAAASSAENTRLADESRNSRGRTAKSATAVRYLIVHLPQSWRHLICQGASYNHGITLTGTRTEDDTKPVPQQQPQHQHTCVHHIVPA